MLVLSIIFLIFGFLIFLNIIGMFLNQYFPPWYPTVELLLFIVYAAGIVMIIIWMCNDTKGSRTSLRVAGYLIIGSVAISLIVAIIYLTAFCKTPYVMVGTGDK